MNLADFKSQIGQMEDLSEEIEKIILDNAGEAFDEVAERATP